MLAYCVVVDLIVGASEKSLKQFQQRAFASPTKVGQRKWLKRLEQEKSSGILLDIKDARARNTRLKALLQLAKDAGDFLSDDADITDLETDIASNRDELIRLLREKKNRHQVREALQKSVQEAAQARLEIRRISRKVNETVRLIAEQKALDGFVVDVDEHQNQEQKLKELENQLLRDSRAIATIEKRLWAEEEQREKVIRQGQLLVQYYRDLATNSKGKLCLLRLSSAQ